MNRKQLLERLLGAILVSAFGFILYSAFLDSSGQVYVDRSTQIPAQTRFIDPLEIDNKKVMVDQSEKTAKEIFVPTQEVSAETALEAPVTEEGMPNAWVIQVGSFSSSEKADEIRDQLIQKSYKAYHRQLESSSLEELYRVLIGPYMNAEEAVRHQREVDQILNLSTLLMKFEP